MSSSIPIEFVRLDLEQPSRPRQLAHTAFMLAWRRLACSQGRHRWLLYGYGGVAPEGFVCQACGHDDRAADLTATDLESAIDTMLEEGTASYGPGLVCSSCGADGRVLHAAAYDAGICRDCLVSDLFHITRASRVM